MRSVGAVARRWSRRPRNAKAYTRLELLVVGGIIAVLVAALLPALATTHRASAALVARIAYIDDDGHVHVCAPDGGHEFLLSPIKGYGRPAWSPRGDRIAYQGWDHRHTVIVTVSSGATQLADYMGNLTWVDEDTIVGFRFVGSYTEIRRLDVRTGMARPWQKPPIEGLPSGGVSCSYDGRNLKGFVVAEHLLMWNPSADVAVRDDDWRLRQVIWTDPGGDVPDYNPAVDPSGELAAWTRGREAGFNPPFCVALKSLREPADVRPRTLATDVPSSLFCDFTESGDLLVTVRLGQGWRLAVYGRDGKRLRMLDTGANPSGSVVSASWRRRRA